MARQLDQMKSQVLALGTGTKGRELSEAYGELGRHYQTYELDEAAEASYKNAIRLHPYNAGWTYYLGYLYQKAGRLEEAADYYALTLVLRPNSLPALVHMAEVYLARDRPEVAEPLLKKVLAEDPESGAANALLGELALGRRQYESAVKYLQTALERVPEANRLHYPLALAYRGLGEPDKAREHLEKRGVVGVRAPDPLIDQLQELRQGELAHLLRGRMAFNAGHRGPAPGEARG